jgi:hypothetical protein
MSYRGRLRAALRRGDPNVNDQERQIISDIFKRLEQTAGQQRDPEAERFIAEKVRQQPYAPYAMAQALYVQEEALKSLNEQIEQLRAESEQLRSQGNRGSGGFLSSIFGGGQGASSGAFSRPGQQPGYAPQPNYAQQGGPWGGQGAPQQGGPWGGQPAGGFGAAPAGGGGGFLRGALTTAAGVAGGMVVGNALMNAFSGGHSALGNFSQSDMASLGSPLGGGDANPFSGDAGFSNAGFDQGGGAGFQDASFDPGGDFGGDMGGDDDSSWT